MASGLEALSGLFFREQAVVDSVFAGVVDAVGDGKKGGIDPGELKVVVDLMEEIAESGSVAVAGTDEAGELRGEFLLDGFFEDGAAHDGAGGEEAVEEAAGGFVEVAIGFFRGGCGDGALAQPGGALDGGLDKMEQLEDKGGAKELVLLGVECALNGLPCGRRCVCRLEAGERGKPLARMLDKALSHFVGEAAPVGDERSGVVSIACAEFAVDDGREDAAELREAVGAGELGDGVAEVAAGRVGGEELLLELGDADGHG